MHRETIRLAFATRAALESYERHLDAPISRDETARNVNAAVLADARVRVIACAKTLADAVLEETVEGPATEPAPADPLTEVA